MDSPVTSLKVIDGRPTSDLQFFGYFFPPASQITQISPAARSGQPSTVECRPFSLRDVITLCCILRLPGVFAPLWDVGPSTISSYVCTVRYSLSSQRGGRALGLTKPQVAIPEPCLSCHLDPANHLASCGKVRVPSVSFLCTCGDCHSQPRANPPDLAPTIRQ
jgi:hypothetical protein